MAEKQKMTPSEAIVEQLRMEGVEYCAGIVGSWTCSTYSQLPAFVSSLAATNTPLAT